MVREKVEILQALSKIVKTDIFRKSELYIKLLEFLVDSFIKNDPVKESILEVELSEIFGKGNSYDGKVRVYMFNLRKKLDEYYRTEGVDDEIVFKIEKGQYNLSVDIVKADKASVFPILKTVTILFFLIVLVVGGWFVFLYNTPENCWASFLSKESESVCYVGDHYTIWGNINGKQHASIHFEGVNTESEFDELLHSGVISDSLYNKTTYSFVTKMGPICSAKLMYWFSKYNKELDIKMESEFVASNLAEENIVYIGPYKTLTGLESIFLRDSEKFGFDGSNIIDKEKGGSLEYSVENNISVDYVMVSYNPISTEGNKVLFFASNNDIGVMAAVSNFTNEEWLNDFYKGLPDKSSHFNALFRVKGFSRTNIECELVSIEILE